jgi:Kef-type K+ transport system membrane component KefB
MKPGGNVPEIIVEFSEIGVIFLLFIAGLETDITELAKTGMKSLVIALGGIIVSGGLATLVFTLVKGNLSSGLFLGVVVTATSVSISVQTLREMGKMKTKEGVSIIGAAILDDIIGILLITVMLGLFSKSGGESSSITHVLGSIGSFFGLIAVIGAGIIFIVKQIKRGEHPLDLACFYQH